MKHLTPYILFESYKDVDWKDIKLKKIKTYNPAAEVYKVVINDETIDAGITIEINKKPTRFHMGMHEKFQGSGLGEKIMKAAIDLFGEIHIGKSTIANKKIISIINKIKQDPLFAIEETEYQYTLKKK